MSITKTASMYRVVAWVGTSAEMQRLIGDTLSDLRCEVSSTQSDGCACECSSCQDCKRAGQTQVMASVVLWHTDARSACKEVKLRLERALPKDSRVDIECYDLDENGEWRKRKAA